MSSHRAAKGLATSWTDEPLARLRAELYCLSLVFRFHTDNHDGRKAVTLVLVAVWAVIEVGGAFGFAALPSEFFYLRLLVGVVIGRMWGIQINNIAGVSLSYGADDDDGD